MYLLFYDITENSIRTRVAKLLEKEGFERLQFSVFIGTTNPKHFDIWKNLAQFIKSTPHNKIYYLRISKENFYNIKTIGNFDQDLKFLAGDRSSLIL